uniref:Sugar ABC transporter permease n=1 Tax=Dictyoglomus turgidum TaxID=513050 RepID=A0A7C3WS51_9BACT
MNTKLRKNLEGLLYILPFGIFWLIFSAFPTLYGFFISLFEWNPLKGSKFVGLNNYIYFFTHDRFWNSLYRTLEFAVIFIFLTIFIALFFALILYFCSKDKLRAFSESVLFFPYLLNVSVIALIWKWLFDPDFGLLTYFMSIFLGKAPRLLNSTLWAIPVIAIASAWWLSGYRTTIFLTALESVPKDLVEAARIDGANTWTIIRKVLLPLIKPQFLFSLVLTTISGFTALGQVMIMTDGGPGYASEVLALYLYRLGFQYFDMGKAAAAGSILVIIMLILTLSGIKVIGLGGEIE